MRVFMDDPGYFEDPATGSAAGDLAGYLLECFFGGGSAIRFPILQGVEMGRPSHIEASAERRPEGSIEVRIGGRVCLVAEGCWR